MRFNWLTNGSSGQSAIKIACVYAIVGGLWIAFSDHLIALLAGDDSRFALHLQTLKGWAYVGLTAWMLYGLISRSTRSLLESREALEASQRTLFNMFRTIPGMAYRCRNDRDWTMEFVSDGCRDLTGHDPQDLIDNRRVSYASLIHPDDFDMVWSEVQRALEERRPFQIVYRIRNATGEERWVWERGVGRHAPSGETLGVEGFMIDISERKRIIAALAETEELYRKLVESTSDAIAMLDTNRVVLSVNQGFVDLFGYEREEIEGDSICTVHLSEENCLEFARKNYPIIADSGPMRIEWTLRRKDGTLFPIEATYSAIQGEDGGIKAYVGIIRDITARKRAEAELRAYQERLEEMVKERTRALEEAHKALIQKEKLKTLGALTAEVAHEIRNPLVSIGGFALRLRKKHPDAPEVDIIVAESRRLEIVLDRIKNYLKPVEMCPRDCDVNEIVRQCLDLLSSELTREGVKVDLALGDDLPPAHVDPDILMQVFIDVVKNALKLMAHARRILAVESFAADQGIHVVFQATMNGIKVKDPEMLYLPFDEGGQNVGVSLSYKLLRGMGGLLTFAQHDNQAAFTISLGKTPTVDDRGLI